MTIKQSKGKRILSAAKLRVVDEYIKSYIKFYPNKIERFVLFGSQARGQARNDSDLDLLIVANVKEKDVLPSSSLWQKAVSLADDVDYEHNYKIGISPKLVTKKYFNKWSPFINNVRQEGVSLWEKKK